MPLRHDVKGQLFVNGVENGVARSDEANLLEFRFQQKTEEGFKSIRDFEAMHMKFMHLVLISEDLESFAHVHPAWDKSTASFSMALNINTVNPDNQDAFEALRKGGRFFVYAEVKSTSLGMFKKSWNLEVKGPEEFTPPKSDAINSNGVIEKHFSFEGLEVESHGFYKATFQWERVPACGGALVQADIVIYSLTDNGQYQVETDVKPWMMMGAHALVLGNASREAGEKNFAHIHLSLIHI